MHAKHSDLSREEEREGFLAPLALAIKSLGLRGKRVLVGVSGGADSVGLMRGLRALAEAGELELVAAHLDHGIRRRAGPRDAAWTAALCRHFDIPIVVEKADVPAYASEHRMNIEEAARTVRYEFFERAARVERCSHVAVAHTADDQVETVLHHLFRGTGLAGLRGMQAVRPLAEGLTLVRPLLRIRRGQIVEWLREVGQRFCTDATNLDESRTRNRIRHSVLPTLERELGPPVRDAILRVAEQAGELQSAIEELAAGLLTQCIQDETTDVVRLNAEVLSRQPRHLVREVFVELWKRKNWPRQAIGFDDWDKLWRLVKQGGSATLPGAIKVTRRGTLIVIRGPAS